MAPRNTIIFQHPTQLSDVYKVRSSSGKHDRLEIPGGVASGERERENTAGVSFLVPGTFLCVPVATEQERKKQNLLGS